MSLKSGYQLSKSCLWLIAITGINLPQKGMRRKYRQVRDVLLKLLQIMNDYLKSAIYMYIYAQHFS